MLDDTKVTLGQRVWEPTLFVGSQITCHLPIPLTAAMQVVSDDVIEPLSQTRVIFQNPSETTPKSPTEDLGRRAGAFAQFRHVTAGTKQVLAESPTGR
jgi:hypothetical protein